MGQKKLALYSMKCVMRGSPKFKDVYMHVHVTCVCLLETVQDGTTLLYSDRRSRSVCEHLTIGCHMWRYTLTWDSL